MIIRLFAIVAVVLTATANAHAQAYSVGERTEEGRTFLFHEPLEGVFSTGWSGVRVGGNGRGQTDVHVMADGKTVFEGTLSINCAVPSQQFWRAGGNNAFLVPRQAIDNARRLFCTASCPQPNTNGLRYVSRDPSVCARIRYVCQTGEEPFSSDCGCGCKPGAGHASPAPVPAPAPAPPQPSARFVILDGYDLFGNDYHQVPGKISYKGCLSTCRNDWQCKAFTYNTRFKKCFLKSRAGNRKPYRNAISGIRRVSRQCVGEEDSCRAGHLRNSCCAGLTCQPVSEDLAGVAGEWWCVGNRPPD